MYSGLIAITLSLGPQASSHASTKPAATNHHSQSKCECVPSSELQHNDTPSAQSIGAKSELNQTPSNPSVAWYDHNWLGFAVSFLIFALNLIGLVIIYKQVKVGEIAANAALTTAKSFVDAERPWILIEYSGNTISGFVFTAVNTGKSPAKITWLDPFIPAKLVPIGEVLPTPPPYGYGFFEGGELVNAIWVAPGGKEHIGVFDSFEAFPGWDPALGGYSGGHERLFIFSAIKYQNPFDDRIHETRFSYRLGSKKLFLDGTRGYNQHT